MFNWGKKPDHPMSSVEEARKLLAELPQDDPGKALEETGGWMGSVKDAEGFKPELRAAVLEFLEDSAVPHHDRLLSEYLHSPQLYEAKSQGRLKQMLGFWTETLGAFLASAAELEPHAAKSAQNTAAFHGVLCRGLHAASSIAKCRRLGYRPVEDIIWDKLCQLYQMAERAQLASAPIRVWKSDPLPTSPVQELLRALMLHAAAPRNLAPEHTEMAFRLGGRVSSSFALSDRPGEGLRFCVDLETPGPPVEAEFAPADMAAPRWFGAGTALARIEELLKHDDADVLPTDRQGARAFSVWDKVTVLRHLATYWGEARPLRRSERTAMSGGLQVLDSFKAVRTVMPQTGTDESSQITELKKEKAKLELERETVDRVPEVWALRDVSHDGIGADIPPRADLWVKVGRICAVKLESEANWWVGVVRWLDAGRRGALRVGIDLLSRRPRALWLKFVGEGQTAAQNWETSSGSYSYDYLNVVLLFPDGARSLDDATMLMEPEGFKADFVTEALMGEKSRLVRLGQPVATGDDYVIASCKWL